MKDKTAILTYLNLRLQVVGNEIQKAKTPQKFDALKIELQLIKDALEEIFQ